MSSWGMACVKRADIGMASALGLLWPLTAAQVWWLAPALSIGLPLLAGGGERRSRRFGVALAYMLPATWGILPSCSEFFPGHGAWIGIASWLATALILAAPYVLAKNGRWTVMAMLLQAIPPIGLVDVISPFAAAGVDLGPGSGAVGILVLLAVIGGAVSMLANDSDGIRCLRIGFILPLLAGLGFVHVQERFDWRASIPKGWAAVSTQGLLPSGGNVFKSLSNAASVVQAGLAYPARFEVFPEAVLDDMLPGTVDLVEEAIPAGETWLIGAENGETDSVYAFRRGGTPAKLFDSALPMPLSMWRPGSRDSYQAAWWEPVRKIGRLRIWSSICYEQVLPWAWLEALWQRPDLILLQSNAWWADQGNPSPAIQAAQARAWALLLGVPVIRASNTR
ncbi:MAG: hypothetical protein M0T84_07045 [Betaproteobacteria bacterium]|nr:hypothetical protein [Betaproteobacteria bacterium]